MVTDGDKCLRIIKELPEFDYDIGKNQMEMIILSGGLARGSEEVYTFEPEKKYGLSRRKFMAGQVKARIIRSKRRTVGLEINQNGELIVRVPQKLSRAAIEEIIERHRKWIDRKLAKLEKRQKFERPRKFEEGEGFLLLGREYPLVIGKEPRPALRFTGQSFILAERWQARAKEVFEKWYRRKALAYLEERTKQLASLHGFGFKKFRLSSARTRWGSCSAKGTISLSWRLIMAPPEIIDYVILHELAHTREKNHSRSFWTLLASFVPDYKEKRRWLKRHGFRLNI